MPRRKPASAKQRKAELQLKRAVKRGDIPAPAPQPKPPRGKKSRPGASGGVLKIREVDPSSKRLQSAFMKVEPKFLEKSKEIASTEPLPRPLSRDTATLCLNEVGLRNEAEELSCPKRPKWRFDMEKKEVERNEEAIYQKWMNQIDDRIAAWRGIKSNLGIAPEDIKKATVIPMDKVYGSPTYYERNLEVWRQLWRVSEISQIMLLLLDSRCPALHFPPSLYTYLAQLRPSRPLILVLTKSDLVPSSYVSAWSTWFQERYPSVRVVKVESYRRQDVNAERKGQGQRKHFEPEMKAEDLHALVTALRTAHTELMTPPQEIRDSPEKLSKWKPNVPQSIDWDTALRGRHAESQEGGDCQQFITVGLVGQPNVGKSSLLNALFGAHKVKASRTPGKTKHFQTLFWTPQIRFVDCPGLVMPNYVRMELQVLCGILPISQIPSIPACLHYASCLLPLEQILRLEHPSKYVHPPEDKRTWRDERRLLSSDEHSGRVAWTAMDVLVAYALNKGWVTAKAGRPDSNRAGNAILRALAEGKVRWAYWPPGMPLPEEQSQKPIGIWLGDAVKPEDDTEDDDNEAETESEASSDLESRDGLDKEHSAEETDSNGELSKEEEEHTVSMGRFGALALESDETEGAEDENSPEQECD